MSNIIRNPLAFFAGNWSSKGFTGKDRVPAPNRKEENSNFKQKIHFGDICSIENHEQSLDYIRYITLAWEEHGDSEPFHEELGYFIWDNKESHLSKTFCLPRRITVNAGGR